MSAILMGSLDSGTSAAAGRAAPIPTATPKARTASDFAVKENGFMRLSPVCVLPFSRGARPLAGRHLLLRAIIFAGRTGVKPSWFGNGMALGGVGRKKGNHRGTEPQRRKNREARTGG